MVPQRLILSLIAIPAILSFGNSISTAQNRALKSGESVEVELRAGQSQSYVLTLQPLDFARLSLASRNQDLTIKIFTPAGAAMVAREVSRDTNATDVSFAAGRAARQRQSANRLLRRKRKKSPARSTAPLQPVYTAVVVRRCPVYTVATREIRSGIALRHDSIARSPRETRDPRRPHARVVCGAPGFADPLG